MWMYVNVLRFLCSSLVVSLFIERSDVDLDVDCRDGPWLFAVVQASSQEVNLELIPGYTAAEALMVLVLLVALTWSVARRFWASPKILRQF
jgi:hypothetical protein